MRRFPACAITTVSWTVPCPGCGTRFLAAADEFSMKGAHQRTQDSNKGKAMKKKATPKAVRVLHKLCKGKKGVPYSISLPHAG